MLERLNEIKKAAILMGMNYDTWSEKVVNDKLRKHYQSLRRIKGQNLKYFDKLRKEAKKYNIADITVLDCDKWIGDYGRIASDLDVINYYLVDSHLDAKTKYIYNVIRKLNSNKDNFIFVPIETIDDTELYHLFYVPQGYRKIKYGNDEDEFLIVMKNGQLFDVHNSYYYSKKDSTTLRKMIKTGYDYWSPNTFYHDITPDEEKESYYGFGGWEE